MLTNENKDFLGRGWGFPPTFDENYATLRMVSEEEDIKESIYVLLSTTPGERPMNPTFGCNLDSQVFQVLDTHTLTSIESMVYNAILNFEPRVDLHSVEVDDTNELDGVLDIHIEYTVRRINSRTNIVYPFYLIEGTDLEDR